MTFKPDYLCHPKCVAQAALAEQLVARKVDADEIEALRETNTRLNRRCQTYEAGVAEKVRESGGSLGRSLARAAWEKSEAENEALRERVSLLKNDQALGESIILRQGASAEAANAINKEMVEVLDGAYEFFECLKNKEAFVSFCEQSWDYQDWPRAVGHAQREIRAVLKKAHP